MKKPRGIRHRVKRSIRKLAGKVTDNPKLTGKGRAEKLAGRVQEKAGQVKKVLGK